jgi:glycosyltransferase involved in cell wall biosynthesis
MRFALIIYGSLDTVSGGYLYDRKLVEYLRACGDHVDVLTLPWRSYAEHLGDNRDAAMLAERVGDVDVLLQDELNHPSLIALNRRLRGKVPIVSIVHHLRVSERHDPKLARTHTLVERAYLRTCDAFVFNSQTTRMSVEALLGESRPNIVAYPAGDRFDVSSLASRALGSPPVVLFVGNVIERKGLHTVVDALVDVPGWQLRIVGRENIEPGYVARVRARIDVFGLTERVAWLGALDDAALAREYERADALAVPSQYEGFGIVYLEAMGFGVPVIASRGGAAVEIVDDGVNGALVNPDDAPAVAAGLRALSDGARHARMRAAARARYDAHPTWQAGCAAIRAFLAGNRLAT